LIEKVNLEPASIPERMGDSILLAELSRRYAYGPSTVMVRTAEAELFRAVPITPPALDLCCGDGYFASLLSVEFDAGCDFSEKSIKKARKLGVHKKADVADVTKELPYPDQSFNTIISNSSLEHVENIDAALVNARRVLKPGGRLIFTLASDLAYEWWPCGNRALEKYLSYQPVYNYFSLDEWKERLDKAGLSYVNHQYYLSKTATKVFLFLDYHFSRVNMSSEKCAARPVIQMIRKVPARITSRAWSFLFSGVRIITDGKGGGILIVAERKQ